MNMRWLLATMAFTGLITPSTGQVKVIPYEYEGADYSPGPDSGALKVFPSKGDPITIGLPFYIKDATFGPDGKSIYGIIADRKSTVVPDRLGISTVEFNPIRATLIPGTSGFVIHSFAISGRQNKLAISGNLQTADGRRCGVFEILIPEGNVRQVLKGDCHDQWSWDHLSLSPNGEQAIATVGSNTTHDLHLELIDLVHGTTKSLGDEFSMGAWSPDGKWIAVRKTRGGDKLFLLETADFSHRRPLGAVTVLMPTWSPDSRYLLLWKDYIFRCGFYLDVDPPSTLEILDIRSGKKTTIRNSRCQIGNGPTGWISDEIAK